MHRIENVSGDDARRRTDGVTSRKIPLLRAREILDPLQPSSPRSWDLETTPCWLATIWSSAASNTPHQWGLGIAERERTLQIRSVDCAQRNVGSEFAIGE
jgi:hypothetical protein